MGDSMAAKRGRGKTRTIKQRTVYVYLPSKKAVALWHKEAAARGVSLSQFVFESVEAGIDPGRAKAAPKETSDELAEKVADLEERLRKATADLKVRDAALEKLEADLRRYRLEALKPKKGSAFRKYERRIIDTIREHGEITNLELMAALRVPPGDRELVEAIRGQLDGLAEWNVIRPTANGWRWALDRE